jgi:glycosyltransferase involved in cell wall biosynthesis
MRIAWVVPGRVDQPTGGYVYDRRVIDGLRSRGHRVDVVELSSNRWPVDPAAARELRSAVRGAGVVVVDELAHPALVGPRLDQPTVALVHHLRASEPAPGAARAVARTVERAALRCASAFVCTSRTTESSLRQLMGDGVPIAVAEPGPGLLEPIHPVVARERPAALRVLCVAHWTPRKGILEALDALAMTSPHVRLDLVGQTDRDPIYAARVELALQRDEIVGHVRVHGAVGDLELATCYANADAFLLLSSHEGYGMAIADAIRFGLPVVATRVGAIPEVACDGHEAILVEPGDARAAARALDGLLDTGEWSRRAAFARERATTLGTWRAATDRIEAVLRAVAGGG